MSRGAGSERRRPDTNSARWRVRRDGVLDTEVRIVLETDDKQMICMHRR